MNSNWTTLASEEKIQKVSTSLQKNGFDVLIVDSGDKARVEVLKLIPEGSEVQVNTSETLRIIGLADDFDESGKFQSVRNQTMSMDRDLYGKDIKKFKSVPDFAVGSAHAITEKGEIIIASKTGSQIPSYAFGANKVILVVGIQKVVTDIDHGIKRIYEHSLPLESERAKKAYGVPGSDVNKMLIMTGEPEQGRTTVILVKENLGY